ALFGCYSFVNHVLANHPDTPARIDAPTVLEAVRARFEAVGTQVVHAAGCAVADPDTAAIADAVTCAEAADVVLAVLGDQAGLFGRGTSGEGCDTVQLSLPGVQTELVEALLATGKPVVLVLVTGRPYAIGPLVERAAATLQVFFPGQAGGAALAGVLAGDVSPSGRLAVSIPPGVGVEPYSYLRSRLAEKSTVSAIDPTPRFAFGHGLSYTTFEYSRPLFGPPAAPTDGWLEAAATVTNTGRRAGAEVVQLYARDLVASVTRPVAQLVGFRRVELAPGAAATVSFRVPTARLAFHDRQMRRVVEPGAVELWFGRSSAAPATAAQVVELVGELNTVSDTSPRLTEVAVALAPAGG
ncbi:MAG: glycoside hydrolase family 3 C-terminal domain-containing protein, partial [Bifidobacteriaceae bacterium]|nr:glycoside hydrolase family 3 C-terminal domain-containing protein [Bifidobacteriaceae bacterium]